MHATIRTTRGDVILSGVTIHLQVVGVPMSPEAVVLNDVDDPRGIGYEEDWAEHGALRDTLPQELAVGCSRTWNVLTATEIQILKSPCLFTLANMSPRQ